jgi:hypothetical protein
MKKRRLSVKKGEGGYMYGFDPEYAQAWRQKLGQPREWANDIKEPDDASGDHPVAVFSDGSERAILSITMEQYKATMKVSGGSNGVKGKLWHHGTAYIAYRKDRNPLLILYQEKSPEQEGSDVQLCQVTVAKFGDPGDVAIQIRQSQHPDTGLRSRTCFRPVCARIVSPIAFSLQSPSVECYRSCARPVVRHRRIRLPYLNRRR